MEIRENLKNIVILHGWGADSTRFNKMKVLLEEQDFCVWIPDLPGFGKEAPPSVSWSLDDYVNWVLEGMKKRDWQECFILGHSFGGRIAIKFAAQQPSELKGLILASAAGIKHQKTPIKWVVSWLVEVGKWFFSLPGLKVLYKFARWTLYKVMGEYDYYRAQGTMRQTLVNILEEDLRGLLPEINVPVLLLWGETDKLVPLKDAKIMEKEIPNARLKVFKGEGHLFLYVHPKLVVEEIMKFVSEI